jgi:carbonic anhydrase
VFLIAVPLSLSIAAASGAPMLAGLIAAVVGGVVAGALGGSPLQVSGPAAGLTVVVAGIVQQYGWAATAAITCAAGVVQLILGATRIGRLALSLSPAVVHGMLAGIGVTIVVQQLHVVLGGETKSSVLDNVIDMPAQLLAHHTASVIVGVLTVLLLVVWPRIPKARLLPAPLVAVVAVTALSAVLALDVARVSLPENPLAEMVFPVVPSGGVGGVVTAVLTVALVASVESLLSAVAVDKMHDDARSNLDRELIGQGAANTISGALGGMPVTGVIVRSSTNVQAGGRTRASAVLHGLWVALFVLLATGLLEMIPMAVLAGVLLVTGARLVSLGHIRTFHRHYELLVYAVTVLGVALAGLAEGVLIGIGVSVLRALYRLTHATVTVTEEPGGWRVRIHGSLAFVTMGQLVRRLREIPFGHRVVLELHVDYMDHAAFDTIDGWRADYTRRGGGVHIDEIHDTWYDNALRGEPGRRRTLPSALPRWFAPWSYWQGKHDGDRAGGPAIPRQGGGADPIMIGMREFEHRSADLVRPFLSDLAANGQRPTELFITCADSRLVPNLITSSGPGDLFCLRNIGNLVPPHRERLAVDGPAVDGPTGDSPTGDSPTGDSSVGAAVEYAVDVLGIRTIVVCGHSHCGAMAAIAGGSARPGSALHSWLREAGLDAALIEHGEVLGADGAALSGTQRLAVLNVAQQLTHLAGYPCVRAAIAEGRLELAGMYFDIGEARMYLVGGEAQQDARRIRLRPVSESTGEMIASG